MARPARRPVTAAAGGVTRRMEIHAAPLNLTSRRVHGPATVSKTKEGLNSMSMVRCYGPIAVFGLALAGCSPADLETAPVVVPTAQGSVTCQLYSHTQVYWDRSTDRPDSMSVKTADDVCRTEGYRLLRAGQ